MSRRYLVTRAIVRAIVWTALAATFLTLMSIDSINF